MNQKDKCIPNKKKYIKKQNKKQSQKSLFIIELKEIG